MNLTDGGPRVSDAELNSKAGGGLGTDFMQGLRSGANAATSQLHKLAGTTMNAVGLDGSEQNAKAAVDSAYSQVDGQDLVPFHDIKDVSSGLRWGAGMLGQSVPMVGAALGAGALTGGAGVLPALAAGTAAVAPMEIGAQLQRQEQDPANRYATPAQNLRAAVPTGAAAAAAYNVIPAGVAHRMIGKAGGGLLPKVGADIVGQGVATGVGEGIHQVGDNIVNPNAGFDVGKMIEAVPEGMAAGAVFGGAHVAKHVIGSPGRVFDSAKGLVESAKGLVPDSVKERFQGGKKETAEATDAAAEWTKDKFDYTAEAAEKAAAWAKGTIKAKVADVQTWGKEFMDDPAAPESFKAKVQDAIRNPGDQAKAAWLATQAFAKQAKDAAGSAIDKADFPSRLRAVHKTMSDGSKSLMERLSRGEETADTAEILKADGDPAKLTEIFDKADQTTMSKLKEWGDGLLNEHLGEEKTAQVKQWMSDLGDKASQQGIAAMRMAQDAGKDLADKAGKFADAAKAKVSDATAKKSDTLPEGLREKIGTAIMDVLGDDHPALNSRFARSERGDVRVPLQDLADGLRHVVIAAAEGKPVSSSALVHLYDVAGDKTRALIDAVHTAVGEPAAGNADFFKSIEAAVQAGKGRDGVLKTMQKSLKPELQAAVRPAELKKEAEVLRAWLMKNDSDAKAGAHKVVDGQAEISEAGLTASAARIAHRDALIRDALEHRYGNKADAVLEAVRADIAKEQHLTEPTRTEKLDSDNDVREDVNAGKREGKGKDETTRTHFYPQKGQLYLDPQEVVKGKNTLYDDPATQRIKTAKKENPDAQVEFRRVKDLDEKDPEVKKMVDAKYEDLVETAMNEGLTETEAMARATKELDSYGLVVAEQSKQETRITPRELDSMRLSTDPKYAGSKSRIDTIGPKQRGNVILDGVKITEFMNRKMKGANEYSSIDDLGPGYRDARMFAEGVAALTDRLGHSFKIPDSTQITRQGMTWEQAKKLLAGKEGKSSTPTKVNKGADLFEGAETMVPGSAEIRAKVRRLAKQRADIEADVQEIGEARIEEMKAMGIRLTSKNVGEAYARAREPFEEKLNTIFQATQKLHKENVGDDSAGFQAYDETGFGGEIERGINVNKLTHDRPVKGDLKKGEFDTVAPGIKPGSTTQSARTQRINELEGDMSRLDMNKLSDRVKSQALWREAEILRNLPAEPLGSGRSEIDPFGPTHDVMRGKGEFVADKKGNLTAKGDAEIRPISINADGSARDDTVMGRRRPGQSHPDAKQLPTQPTNAREAKAMSEAAGEAAAQKVIDLAEKMGDSKVAVQRALAEKIRALDVLNKKYLTKKDKEEFYSIPDMESMADRAEVINRLTEKYRERIEGGPPSPKALAAKKAAFLEKTRSGDPELLKTLASHDDAKALQRAVEALKNEHGENSEQAIDTINRRIVELIQDPDVRYGMLLSKQHVTPGQAGPVNRKAAMDYLERVHGPNIQVAWKNILHAGEFERTATGDVIRLSIHSLDPTSIAYHEALHGFMAKLHDARHGDIAAVLTKAGESASVMKQLREHLKNEPDALKQLSDPEERAAYMYQFWAQGKLKLGEKATTIFQRVAKFLREVTGMWTNDQRAEKIMEYFHSGEYEKNRHLPNAVRRALMEAGTSRVFEKAKAMTEPLREMGEALASAGGTRLRDTGIPALRELADAMKLKTTTEGADPGYMPAARGERSRVMNQIGSDLKGYTADQLDAALHQLQTGQRSNDVKVRTAATVVSKHLDNMLTYMQGAGVRIEHLGMTQGVPYFPRSWDASYISTHQKEFLAMIAKYPQFYGDPHKTMQKLMVTDGAEFNVEVDKPGMQASKERTLAFISHADAAPFMRKNLHQILNSYVTQATRRAEWARRFKDDGSGVRDLIAKAEQQGATAAQLEAASKFVRAVDGTLGDTINPVARRAMGDMLVYQNIRLLPLAIFSSMVDSQGIMVRGGTVGESFSAFKRGMKEVVKNFQKDPKSDAMTELAEAIGTIDNAHLVHTMGASYSQGMVGDRGRAINDTFFRLNLMEQYNASMRVSATEAALNFIARHATRPGQHSERFLRELGLEAKDVQIGQHGRPKILEHEGLSLAESAKMKAAVNRWVDGAVLRPDAVDKPIWMSDPHFALVAHLKQFVFSFHETILKRVMHEAQNGNFSPALALASYVPMMIAADMIKGLIQGGGDQPQWKAGWGVGDYLWNGGERAGLFGTAQFAIDALGDVQRGGSGVGALSGPTIEQLTDAVRVMGGREHFKNFAVDAMPANTLYSSAFDAGKADPKFSE